MSTTSIIELIALEIVRRLEQITTDNDYSFSACDVVRPDRTGKAYAPEDKLIVVKQGDSTKNEEASYPGNPPAIAYDVTFEIDCFLRSSDFDADEYNIDQNERGSQIIKALTTEATDPGAWYSLEGNAILADFGNIKQFSVSESNHNGVTVELNVLYRTSENDPYEVRT